MCDRFFKQDGEQETLAVLVRIYPVVVVGDCGCVNGFQTGSKSAFPLTDHARVVPEAASPRAAPRPGDSPLSQLILGAPTPLPSSSLSSSNY